MTWVTKGRGCVLFSALPNGAEVKLNDVGYERAWLCALLCITQWGRGETE